MTTNIVMERRALGRTGIQVTPIGLGGAWLGYSDATHHRDHDVGAAAVVRAMELGIRLIDTSGGYGESEDIIGKGLREWYRCGGRREDVVISTKTGTRTKPRDYSAAATYRSVEHSLMSLGTEYIDVMLVHDPETLDPAFAPGGALEALCDLKAQGVIRAIGLGVRNHDHHRRFIESGAGEVSLTYGDYNLLNQTAAAGILPLAARHETGIFNAMVVEYGLLSGQDPHDVQRQRPWFKDHGKLERACKLWDWAQSRQVDLLSVAIQFSTREPRIAATLVGAARPDEIETDVNAFTRIIPDIIWEDLYREFGL